MKEKYLKIKELIALHKNTDQGHLNKLMEEVGELAQEINKLNGLKRMKNDETLDSVKKNIVEELADCLQCIFAISNIYDIPYNNLKEELDKKNLKYAQDLTLNPLTLKKQ